MLITPGQGSLLRTVPFTEDSGCVLAAGPAGQGVREQESGDERRQAPEEAGAGPQEGPGGPRSWWYHECRKTR